jgi:tetratricopeptide (TPR) repeat protein
MSMRKALFLSLMLGLLAGCATLQGSSPAQSAFDTGLALFNRGAYDEASGYFIKATELEPDFAPAYLYLGRSYLNLSRWFEAVPALRTALRLAPQDTRQEAVSLLIDALFGAASAASKHGDWLTAITMLREILMLSPGAQQATTQLVAALLSQGKAWLAQGKIVAAIQLYREALQVAPQSPPVLSQLVTALLTFGGQLLAQGKGKEAVQLYMEVSQMAPKNLEAYLGLARALLQDGQYIKAFTAAQEALRLAPASPEALALFQQLQRH